MKERPILFSGEMVNAILDGRKTQTRRVVKKQPHGAGEWVLQGINWLFPNVCPYIKLKNPYGVIGDRLWVRETFRIFDATEECSHYEDCSCSSYHGLPMYKADKNNMCDTENKWKPSIYMPRWASRINLEITNIRVERLQDITETEAIAEGVSGGGSHPDFWVGAFADLWDSINAKRGYGWDANPWVWVVEFKRI